jgi:hypothetical protein
MIGSKAHSSIHVAKVRRACAEEDIQTKQTVLDCTITTHCSSFFRCGGHCNGCRNDLRCLWDDAVCRGKEMHMYLAEII